MRVELLAVLPECGNGEKQHSEACEDGNVVAGDGCDPFCRFELDASERAELEPNDDLSGGNVLAIEAAGSPFVARGRLEGLCDPEVFSFELTADRNATIRVVAPALDECIVPSPGTAMQITLYYGLTEIARTVSDAEGCLVLDSVPLKPRSASDEGPTATGSYHLQLRALPFDELVPVDYALVIELE